MNILVTGGAGFIGSATARALTAQGHKVVVLDNFNPYYEVSLKEARVAALLSEVEIVNGDIRDREMLDGLFTKYKFDAVCHLAAMAGVRYSVQHPHEYIDNNLNGLVTLLEAMKSQGIPHLVFASTSSVYGNDTKAPFAESATAAAPESVYGATKRAGELLLHSYHQQYSITATALRFFTVYGPWGRPDMALFKFTSAMLKHESIDIYNNGEMTRDFTYIDDIVSGVVAAVEKPLGYEIINLGRGKPAPLMEYVAALEAALGVTAEKNFLPMQTGDVYVTDADITKARMLLGYDPQTSVQDGVRQFVHWYKTYYQ